MHTALSLSLSDQHSCLRTVSDLLGEFSHYSATWLPMSSNEQCVLKYALLLYMWCCTTNMHCSSWPVEAVSDLLGEFSRYSHSWMHTPLPHEEMRNKLKKEMSTQWWHFLGQIYWNGLVMECWKRSCSHCNQQKTLIVLLSVLKKNIKIICATVNF